MAMKTGGPYLFADSERELLGAVLDRIIPATEGFPGIGQLGGVGHVDGAVGESAEMKSLFSRGLAAIEARAADFAALSDGRKDELLRRVESEEPEFFQALVRLTYNGYYTNPRVLELLGLEARPPQPLGHLLEQGSLELIENVKRRGRVYREV